MAVKLWQEGDQWHYRISCYQRGELRDNRKHLSASGCLGSVDEAKAIEVTRHIEKSLEMQAAKACMMKDLNGVLWKDLVAKWKTSEIDELPDPEFSNRRLGTAEGHWQRINDFTRTWDRLPAKDITPAEVESVLTSLKTLGYAASSRYNVKVSIKQVFDWAIKRRLLPGVTASPTVGISISRKSAKRSEILSLDQACVLIEKSEELKHPWSSVWKGALHTGGRSGELQELRCKNLDRESRLILFENQYNTSEGRVTDLKDHEWRYVPINDELDELFVQIGAYDRAGDDHVFPRLPGWKHGEQARILRSFCDEIRIPTICFHSLRAIWAVQLLRNGVDRLRVQKLGGWASVEAMEHYIRLAGIDIEGATDSLSFKRKRGRPARVLKLISGSLPVEIE